MAAKPIRKHLLEVSSLYKTKPAFGDALLKEEGTVHVPWQKLPKYLKQMLPELKDTYSVRIKNVQP